jgi:hypothetical protein
MAHFAKKTKKPPHAFARRGYLFGDCPTIPASRCDAVSANGLFQDDASARDTFLAQTIAVANSAIKKRLAARQRRRFDIDRSVIGRCRHGTPNEP